MNELSVLSTLCPTSCYFSGYLWRVGSFFMFYEEKTLNLGGQSDKRNLNLMPFSNSLIQCLPGDRRSKFAEQSKANFLFFSQNNPIFKTYRSKSLIEKLRRRLVIGECRRGQQFPVEYCLAELTCFRQRFLFSNQDTPSRCKFQATLD